MLANKKPSMCEEKGCAQDTTKSYFFRRNFTNCQKPDKIHSALLSGIKKIIYRIIAGMYFGLLGPNTLYNPNYLDLLDSINWINFKKVCIYPRHKRIYFLLRLNPRIYLMYRNIENTLKKNLLFNFLY